jgi:VanZ family protein
MTVCVAIGIAYLSLKPSVQLVEVNDKIGHFIAYFTLMFVMGLAFWNRKRELFMAFLISAAYGIAMEIGQYFVPGRSFSFLDMVANATGALLATGLLLLIGKNIIHLLRIK